MIRLISVEMQRFVSRRLFKVLSLLVIAGFAIGGVAAFVASSDSPEDIAAHKAEKAMLIDECIRETEARIEADVRNIPAAAKNDPAAYCRQNTWVEHPSFEYRHLDWMLMGFTIPFLIVGWLFGASFVGAEWHNRTMTTLLTWEPRRVRVLAAKAIANALIVFLWVVAFEAIAAAAFYPAARFEGSMAGVDAAWWWDLTKLVLGAGGLGAIVASFGLALGTIGRNTAAALGVGFGYFAILEGLIRAFKPSWNDWLVGPNVALVLNGSEDVTVGHSPEAGALLLTAYVATALLGAAIVFRRRDIA